MKFTKLIKAEEHYIPTALLDALVDKIYVSESKTIKIDLKYCDPYKPIMDYLQEVEVIANVS